jgi:hypothetical protein
MPQHSRCAATLKDGSPCERVTVTPSAPFCSHHTELLANVTAVERMSWPDMHALFAATYVDEIAAVQRSGGAALVRQKLAGLSEDERWALREALAERPSS